MVLCRRNGAHGLVMLGHALHDPQERANLWGDTLPLLIGTAVLSFLAWKARVRLRPEPEPGRAFLAT